MLSKKLFTTGMCAVVRYALSRVVCWMHAAALSTMCVIRMDVLFCVCKSVAATAKPPRRLWPARLQSNFFRLTDVCMRANVGLVRVGRSLIPRMATRFCAHVCAKASVVYPRVGLMPKNHHHFI
eukprot:366157-Chlamydomonas_euryale.AAC.27